MSSPVRRTDRGPIVWYVGLGLVIVLGIIAVVLARGAGDDVDPDVAGRQVAAVEVTGDALPPHDPDAASDAAVGQTIPTLSGTSLDGEALTIGPDGGAKVILFVAHWCPHCQKEVPRIVEHLRDTPMPDDVELLTVSTGVAAERGNYPPSEWLEDEAWTAPVLADSAEGAADRAYGLSGFPYFVVVDAEGRVVERVNGEISVETFDELVAAAGAGAGA